MLSKSQMAIPLSLLLISCSLYSMSSLSTSSLALLVLVLSTCFSLLFSNLRHLKANHKAKPASMEVGHEKVLLQDHEGLDAVERDDDKVLDCSRNDIAQENNFTESLSESSDDSPVTGECSEDSMSDDESLIEISLSDGHYVEQEATSAWKEGLFPEFLPDSLVLDKTGFMDILSEINEEENLIEIDIARGSIKCSSSGIKA